MSEFIDWSARFKSLDAKRAALEEAEKAKRPAWMTFVAEKLVGAIAVLDQWHQQLDPEKDEADELNDARRMLAAEDLASIHDLFRRFDDLSNYPSRAAALAKEASAFADVLFLRYQKPGIKPALEQVLRLAEATQEVAEKVEATPVNTKIRGRNFDEWVRSAIPFDVQLTDEQTMRDAWIDGVEPSHFGAELQKEANISRLAQEMERSNRDSKD